MSKNKKFFFNWKEYNYPSKMCPPTHPEKLLLNIK